MNSRKDYVIEGEGEPVVLLHSSMQTKAQWHRLTALLKQDFRTIAVDLYGYGEGEFPEDRENFSLSREAERVKTIIDETINGDPFHLVGHSYGGATALKLVTRQAHRIKSLALFEPVAFHLLHREDPMRTELDRLVLQICRLLDDNDSSSATRTFIDFWSGNGTYDGLKDEQKIFFDTRIQKVVLDFQAATQDTARAADFSKLQLPVCMIAGHRSPPLSRRIAQILSDRLPNVQISYVSGGHMSPVTNPEEVNPIVAEFIRNS
ncbi:alpha/beta fold hydrolase [Desulforhopalus singaporensis]|uniref:Pimeloyl-ACP methyl ester carboxylesterase n=1 Tax=Desulforhopalus singaporensis TaxID=91360 RepID=A0A1H0TYM0_9BACT|nr:alpha/beta hydrolase [Desulforhopalus singaporensis]SDP59147.1 Pimeloyl-ACP methyl ester carboxylesterase [Desulforhopalus singaporensis]